MADCKELPPAACWREVNDLKHRVSSLEASDRELRKVCEVLNKNGQNLSTKVDVLIKRLEDCYQKVEFLLNSNTPDR
jgi:hypothetical protein